MTFLLRTPRYKSRLSDRTILAIIKSFHLWMQPILRASIGLLLQEQSEGGKSIPVHPHMQQRRPPSNTLHRTRCEQ